MSIVSSVIFVRRFKKVASVKKHIYVKYPFVDDASFNMELLKKIQLYTIKANLSTPFLSKYGRDLGWLLSCGRFLT